MPFIQHTCISNVPPEHAHSLSHTKYHRHISLYPNKPDSSISARTKPHFGRSEEELPEVTSPEVALTGTGSHGSDRVRMRNRFPRFFLTIVVVQNVSLRMTDIATGSDVMWTRRGYPCKGVRIRNRKLRNIRPNGAFLPEMKSSNITWRASPGTGSHVSAFGVLSRTSASYLSFSIPFTGYLSPLSRHKGSAFNNYTKVCCFRICSICTPSSLSRPRSHCEGTK